MKNAETPLPTPEEATQNEAILAHLRLLQNPEPVGKERTLRAVQAAPPSFWRRPQALVGVAASLLFCYLFFPTFSQAKSAAKNPVPGATEAVMKDAMAPASGAPEFSRSLNRADREVNMGSVGSAAPTGEVTMLSPQIIRTASLTVGVKDVMASLAQVQGIAQSLGGMVQASQVFALPGASQDAQEREVGQSSASATIRVPVRRFDDAVAQFRRLGRVTAESMEGQDVTVQVADVEARLRAMRAEESQLLLLVGRANKVGEILQVRDRLNQVRQEIESLDAQSRSLRGQAQYSTINLNLYPVEGMKPLPTDPWWQQALDTALERLSALGRALGVVAINLLVFSPIWGGWMLWWWWRKRVR